VAFGQSETHSCYTVRDNSNPHTPVQSYRIYGAENETNKHIKK